jgi:hypothetical protein
MQLHHGPPGGPPQPGMAPQQQQWAGGAPAQMVAMNEAVWLQIGNDARSENPRTRLTVIREPCRIDGQSR